MQRPMPGAAAGDQRHLSCEQAGRENGTVVRAQVVISDEQSHCRVGQLVQAGALAAVVPLRRPVQRTEDQQPRELDVGLELAGRMQGVQHRRPRHFVLALQLRQRSALCRRDGARLVQHDRNEVAAGSQQHVEMIADQDAQLARDVGGGAFRAPQGLLLARDRRAHALFHHGVQQRALALEMVERRAAAHADGRRDVAGARGVVALAPEQAGGAPQQFGPPVSVVALRHRLARPPARALGRALGDWSCAGNWHARHLSKAGYF